VVYGVNYLTYPASGTLLDIGVQGGVITGSNSNTAIIEPLIEYGVNNGLYGTVSITWDNSRYHRIDIWADHTGVEGVCGDQQATLEWWTPFVDNNTNFSNISTNFNVAKAKCDYLAYTFSVNVSADVKAADNLNYSWTFPSGWTVYGPSSGSQLTSVQATPNSAKNNGIPSGVVTLTVSQPSGGASITRTFSFNALSTPLVTIPQPLYYNCKNSNLQIPSKVTGGATPYRYSWNNYWPSTGQSTATLNFPAGSVTQSTPLTLTVMDNNNCIGTGQTTVAPDNIPDSQKWVVAHPYTGNSYTYDQQVINYTAPIVFQSNGQPYYVGKDGNIWTYQYLSSQSEWSNHSVLPQGLGTPNGSLALVEENGNIFLFASGPHGNGTQGFFLSAFKSNGSTFQPVGPTYSFHYATKLVPGPSGTVIALCEDNLFRLMDTNGNVTLISGTAQGGGNFVYVANYGHIFYQDINGKISAMDMHGNPIPVYTPVGESQPWLFPLTTDIDFDFQGNVYYVTFAGGQILRAAYNSGQYEVYAYGQLSNASQGAASNGDFTLDRSTGAVYFVGGYNDPTESIWQLYRVNGNLYTTASQKLVDPQPGATPPYASTPIGSMNFALPNLFYVGQDYYVYLMYYFTNQCLPSELRVASNQTTSPTVSTNVSPATIYPNPTQGKVTVSYPVPKDGLFGVTLIDVHGNPVYGSQDQISEGRFQKDIDISNLSTGVYLVKLSLDDNQVWTTKIIKE
jgi:hypothetical protein